MQAFTPFPLRARGSLEIFDAAIKLYKQYFWVLLGWSAIVTGATLFGAVLPGGGLAAMFITPLAIGSVVCCVAAAVRGQNVEFGQCWRFTQPRYWMMLGMHLLASLIGSLVIVVIGGLFVGVIIAGVYAFRDSSGIIQLVMGLLALLVLGTIGTIVGTVFMSWMGLVPVVICMEEDKRGTSSLGRAYDILRGHWLRITSLMAIVGLAMLALFAILGGAAALLVGVGRLNDLVQGRSTGEAIIWLGIAAMGLAYALLWIAWTPLYYLILTVFYLDVRVRQEALDLEWTAHTTAPPTPATETQPAFIATVPANQTTPYYPPLEPQPFTPAASASPPAPATPAAPVTPAAPAAPPRDPYQTQRLQDEQAWDTSTHNAPVSLNLPATPDLPPAPDLPSAPNLPPSPDSPPASENRAPQW